MPSAVVERASRTVSEFATKSFLTAIITAAVASGVPAGWVADDEFLRRRWLAVQDDPGAPARPSASSAGPSTLPAAYVDVASPRWVARRIGLIACPAPDTFGSADTR